MPITQFNVVYVVSFFLAFFLSFILTFIVARVAVKKNIVDYPDTQRHFHKNPTPTLGGMAIYISFLIVTISVGLFGKYLLNGNIPFMILVSIWGGGLILMIGGFIDDKYRLPPRYSIMFPILAALTLVSSGIKAVSIHNPLTGDIIFLDQFVLFGVPIVSAGIVFVWVMMMTYTTKLLDGMDGLVTGISAIGALVLFGLSLSPKVMQPQTALLAIIFAGSLLGFLILNFYPARIFLGESGSTFAGFMLAVLAIVSGGKIATALLVMGIPLIDAIWVIISRVVRKRSPFVGDRSHLHFRLTEIGLSQPQAVLLLYALSGMFGICALFLQSRGKMIAFVVLALVSAAVLSSVYLAYNRRRKIE